MSMMLNRAAVIPVWIVAFTLFAWSGWPMPVAMSMLLLIVGITVPLVIFALWNEPPRAIAAVLPAERSWKTRDNRVGRFNVTRDSESNSS